MYYLFACFYFRLYTAFPVFLAQTHPLQEANICVFHRF